MLTTLRSDAVKFDDVGNVPSATPMTVVTPTTVTSDVVTPTTLAKIGSWDIERSEYWSKLFTFTLPGNKTFELLIVLKPRTLSKGVTEATPTVSVGVCITLALKVLIPATFSWLSGSPAIPVFENTDFTSEIP